MNTWIDVWPYFAWTDFGEVCLRHYCLRTATKRESLIAEMLFGKGDP